MSIGLIVKNCESFFSAGINQQSIYTYNLLKKIGYDIDIYCENITSQYLNVGTNTENYNIKTINDLYKYTHTIVICISNTIDTPTYKYLNRNNIKVINLVRLLLY